MSLVIKILTPFVWWFCRLLFGIRFTGIDNIPLSGACIIAPNHVTFADPIWITIPVKRRIYYMAWDKPFDIPILGWLMRAFGAFPLNVETADRSAHRSAIKVLTGNRALVIFPEGGRAKTGKLEPFRLGAFRLALRYGIPIVPVTIRGAYAIWPVGQVLPRLSKQLFVTYHPPIAVERAPDDISKAELKARARLLAQRTRASIASALDAESLPEDEEDYRTLESEA